MEDVSVMQIKSHKAPISTTERLVLEMSYVLPDNRPRIASIEQLSVELSASGVDATSDLISLDITATAQMTYNALAVSEEEEHYYTTAAKFSKQFKESIDVDCDGSQLTVDSCLIDVKASNVEAVLISDRKVNVKIYAVVTSCMRVSKMEDCIDSFTDASIVKLKQTYSGKKLLGSARAQSYIKEDISLGDGTPEIENVLMTNTLVQIDNKRVLDGKLIFYGTVHIDALCSSAGEERFFNTGFDVNFNQACEIFGLDDNSQSVITSTVSDISLDVKSGGVVSAELLVCFDVEAYGQYAQNVIEDAFIPGGQLDIVHIPIFIENTELMSENIGVCSDKIAVADGDVDKVVMSKVTVKECIPHVTLSGVFFDGVYSLSTTYTLRSDANCLVTKKTEIPFSYMIESPHDTDSVVHGGVNVKGVSAQVNDYGEIAIKWVSDAWALATKTKCVNVITSAKKSDADVDDHSCIYYHYVAENETLWDIAKRFSVVPDDICTANGITADCDISLLKGLVIPVIRIGVK